MGHILISPSYPQDIILFLFDLIIQCTNFIWAEKLNNSLFFSISVNEYIEMSLLLLKHAAHRLLSNSIKFLT